MTVFDSENPGPVWPEVERRSHARQPVSKSVTLTFDDGKQIYNGIVMDRSLDGVLIDLGEVVDLPSEVTLQIERGPVFTAHRRWALGTKIGLEFAKIQSKDLADKASEALEALESRGVSAAVHILRASGYLASDVLLETAENAATAEHKLKAVLIQYASG